MSDHLKRRHKKTPFARGSSHADIAKSPFQATDDKSISPVVIAGIEIQRDERNRYRLNDLHRLSGAAGSKKPSRWLANDGTRDLVATCETTVLCQSTKKDFGAVHTLRGGKSPGIYAHELLAVSYAGYLSPVFQLAVNQAFLDLRATSTPQSLPEALRLAADLAERNKDLQLSHDALNQLTSASGAFTATQAAKSLQIQPKRLFLWLDKEKWIYRGGSSAWTAYQSRIESGHLVQRVRNIQVDEHTYKSVQQVLITSKGLAAIALELQAGAV